MQLTRTKRRGDGDIERDRQASYPQPEPPEPDRNPDPELHERGSRWKRMFNSLTLRDFRVLWIGMLFSMAAIQMNIVARSWLAFDISGAALAIGLVAIARGIPAFLITPFGGVAADRFDKRKLLVATQSGLVVTAFATAVLVHLGVIEVWHLMVIGLVQGLIFPFTMPTRTAFMSDLVGDDRLPNAIALDSTGRNLNRVVAPSAAGLLLAVSPTITFYIIAVFYALAAVTMLRLPSSEPDETESEGVVSDVKFGFRYAWEQPTIRSLIGVSFLVVLLGMPFSQLLPVFQEEVLGVGESALGLMYTALGVGAITASLVLASVSDPRRQRLFLIVSMISFGAALALFAISQSYLLSLFLLALVGFSSQGYLTVNKTLIMLDADKALYGRVMSVYMLSWTLLPLSLLPMSAIVDAVGAPLTVGTAGILLCAVGALYAFRQAQARRREADVSFGSD